METFFLILVIILFILAVSDLVVGVSNDAVNFINSALASKAARRWAILLIASCGVFVGATFSDGMMEVARKGIFFPEHFFFSDIMIIFLAVMLTDIILLDFFNTLGLPTSTTVSIVFELLGAAVAVSLIKVIHHPDESILNLGKYINSGRALFIIGGIFLAIFIAFITGSLVQFITRLSFSFDFKRNFLYSGGIFAGIAFTAITYFIFIKGLKHSSFISADQMDWVKHNTAIILLVSFFLWTFVFQLLILLTRLNILKIIVLVGTFSLALAFAGNDLVNFIGVSLAGLKSFQAFIATPGADPFSFTMEILSGKVKTETYLLLIAGLIMTTTLWFSKKAQKVTQTEINLSSQNERSERFGSSLFARSIVRNAIVFNNFLTYAIPKSVGNFVTKRFTRPPELLTDKSVAAYDLLRASVNLTVASILISIGTSYKLPLSTTFVTFMVSMGTSLADKAWSRESAVYRITGVFTVIGGWLLTAVVAFTVSGIFAAIIFLIGQFGMLYLFLAVVLLFILAFYLLIRSHVFHKKRTKKIKQAETLHKFEKEQVFDHSLQGVSFVLDTTSHVYNNLIMGLIAEKRKKLKKVNQKVVELNVFAKQLRDNVHHVIHDFEKVSIETGHNYVQVLDYLREIAHVMTFVVRPVFEHIDNNHKGLIDEQKEELSRLIEILNELYVDVKTMIEEKNFDAESILQTFKKQKTLLKFLKTARKNQVKRIKNNLVSTRNSILYLTILSETKNLALHSGNLVKSLRDFAILDIENNNLKSHQ